jgi:Tfp pilus assembly protein PilV
LLEVLVALMILTATLVPLLTVIGFGSQRIAVGQNEVTALNLAQAYLEEIKDRPAHLVTGVDRTPVGGRPGYAYQVTVTEGAENLKTVTVTVWYPAPGGEKSVSLTTEKLRR